MTVEEREQRWAEAMRAERRGEVSGACVFAGVEGTRPVLVEIQALAARVRELLG